MRKICIVGAGKRGTEMATFLSDNNIEVVFADNDTKKQQNGCMGIPVFGVEEVCKKKKDYLLVVACSRSNYREIEKQLMSFELEEKIDFYEGEAFLDQVLTQELYEKQNKSYIYLCQIVLTERCTLKCKKCAHGCYMTDNSVEDMSFEEVCKTVDVFFNHIDMVYEFVLIGGEPFLYKELGKAISYIGEHYRNRIHIFSITTNGTITPSRDILELCKKYNVVIDISNYSKTIPSLRERLDKLSLLLESEQVLFHLGNGENQWMDYGFETIDRKASPEELKKVFSDCRTPCHEIRGNKLYYCVMARAVSENLHLNVGKEDYLDLKMLEGEKDHETLLKFLTGRFEKGYLDMCNYCRGADAVNYPIPPAEQIRRNKTKPNRAKEYENNCDVFTTIP